MQAQTSRAAEANYSSMMDQAVEDNRIITVEEKQTRKNIGYGIVAITLLGLAVYPPYRSMYGLWSFGFNAGIGLWRTGQQGL